MYKDEAVTLVIPNKNGGYIVSVGKKLVLLNWETGNYTMLAEVENNINGNRFNDGKCDPKGRLWAGLYNQNITRRVSADTYDKYGCGYMSNRVEDYG